MTKDSIISEIRLLLGSDIKKEQIFVIVEGEDDIRFWKSIISSKSVSLYESYDGKCGITKIIDNHFINEYRVFGIRDRDYELNLQAPQIFFYDYSCMEMMLIKSDSAFKKVTSEYYKGNLDEMGLRCFILEELKVLSLMRKNNETLGRAIRFKGLSINNAFSKESLSINNIRLADNIHILNNGNTIYSVDDIKDFELQTLNENELFDITQGHDFTTLMACICSLYLKKNISNITIESGLRCSFSLDDFEKTSLYNDLNSYLSTHNLSTIWLHN